MSEFFFHIKNGKITNPGVVRKYFNELPDGAYHAKIEKKNKRSLPQNAYIHAVLFSLVLEGLKGIGYDDVKTVEDSKLICKTLFLKRDIVNNETGEVLTITKHTSDLTTLEMSEFIEDVIRWGAEYLGIQIPYPNEQTLIFYQ